MLQRWDHLQAYVFPPFGLIPRLLSKVRLSRDLEVTLVAPFWPLKPWFPDLLELLLEVPLLLPMWRDLLKQPHFHHYHLNLPALQYCERSARHLRFSLRVARQLAFCRCSSTRVNYQAKWLAYRGWCRCHGHSISCPFISKIADFLLFLRCSLHLSFSSIASYCSMLSAVFRFVLPSISTPPVLHDLLRSFWIERPLPSSRVPSWDCRRFCLSFAVLLLNLSPLAPFRIFPARSSSLFLSPLLVVLVNSRLSLLRFPFRGMMFSFLIFPNSVLSPSLPPTLFRSRSGFVPCEILLGICRMSCYFALSRLCGFI